MSGSRPLSARSLSVFIPAFNKAENVRPTVETVRRALGNTVEDFEIIIVDDGSAKGTSGIANDLAAENPWRTGSSTMGGILDSVRCAVGEARKQSFVFVPGDNGWPDDSLRRLFDHLGEADVATCYTSNPEVRPVFRRVMSRLYTALLNRLFRHRLRYYNGLTIYPTGVVRSAGFHTRGFGFVAASLIAALDRSLSIVEVGLPITERTSGRSNALRPRNVASVIKLIARLFWRLRLSRRLRASR